MKRFALGLLLCLSIVAVGGASDCHVQQVAAVPVGQIYVPIYSAVYAPPQAQQLTQDVLQEILAELRAMRAELAAIRNPAQAQTLASAVPIIRQQCARCHSPAGADKDGGGFVLLTAQGDLAALSDRDKQRVHNRVSKNSMPPAPAKIDAKDRDAILKAFEKKAQ